MECLPTGKETYSMNDQISIAFLDDEPDTVHIFTYELEKRGFKVFGTSKVDQLFEKLRIDPPQVLLIDMVIPDMPGWQICKKIRTAEEFNDIKIIGISGVFTEDNDVVRLSENLDLYLTKPVDFDVLDFTIRQMTIM
jgi:DNA-binding response OmpR family regulator